MRSEFSLLICQSLSRSRNNAKPYSNALSTDTHYGTVFYQIDELKHEWIPKLVLSSNFDADWNSYMTAYEQCDPQAFLDAAQLEAEARFNS